jgi:hypothetical protein
MTAELIGNMNDLEYGKIKDYIQECTFSATGWKIRNIVNGHGTFRLWERTFPMDP